MRETSVLGTLTIANGGTESSYLSVGTSGGTRIAFNGLVDVIIYAPDTLTAAVLVQISSVKAPGVGDWRSLYVGGSTIAIPAGGAIVVPIAAFKALRVLSAGAEGAARDFIVMGQYDIDT